MSVSGRISSVQHFLLDLQHRLCAVLESEETSQKKFQEDNWTYDKISGGRTCVLQGDIFEQAGVNFSHVIGENLPQAATAKRLELMDAQFEALGVSSVIHPRNPFVPTAHMNVRYFQATKSNGEVVWWFGGGYDLTPYYGFEEDCIHFHKIAKNACDNIHPDFYARFKKNADDYFYLKHRKECRGIGGLFFDDFNELPFEECFAFLKNVGNSFVDAYLPIISKRKSHSYNQQHRDFQRYRRGRYVEFNLVYDRGTLFGLQFGGRIESILMSLPPHVQWKYNWMPEKNSPEEKLTAYFLKPREWV
ncbi:MAG: coproporphyrinogen III oxidase [Gammaproteobacteria bacterium RIFCSPHIGHO2_02_FULL_39_13]|nr:MAG: coproporphyrinogen III oxidase [Gammaproteobacteria bacterium RIFCSPHIGHO2_02_FULL_39_13]OGT49677.1 MAG: coproporphyrinogen III oxidase [Gammaproteobacteria bacterium RIFCSPHIGHO2_12_FULL_39_24]